MTVRELMAALAQMPPDDPVYIPHDEGGLCHVLEVRRPIESEVKWDRAQPNDVVLAWGEFHA